MSKPTGNEPEMKPKVCGHPCEVYSRVVGYFRPINFWNPGKQQEFEDRKTFEVKSPEVGE